MLYLAVKTLISGAIVAAVSEVSKRYPGFGGLVASLPLVSVLGMIWLWRDTRDAAKLAAHSTGTFLVSAGASRLRPGERSIQQMAKPRPGKRNLPTGDRLGVCLVVGAQAERPAAGAHG